MKQQPQSHSDRALENHPDNRHAPEPGTHRDPLGKHHGRGRTDLPTGGASDAEQLLDEQNLQRAPEHRR